MNQSFVSSFKSALFLVVALLGFLQVTQAHAWDGDLGGNQYHAAEARNYQKVQVGVIEDIREVVVTRESTSAGYVGGTVGGLLGGLVGQVAGNGNGRYVAAALAGTIGAVGGKAVGDYVGRETKRSAEIVISMKNGDVFSVVQEMDGDTATLRVGDKVRLMEGQAVRVVKMRQATL